MKFIQIFVMVCFNTYSISVSLFKFISTTKFKSIKLKTSFFVCLLLTTIFCNAQIDSTFKKKTPATEKIIQSVSVELLGQGLLYSINYDRKFSKSNKKFGFKIGAEYLPMNLQNYYAVPIEVYHLFGNRTHYFELGAGLTYLREYKNPYKISFYGGQQDYPGGLYYSGVNPSLVLGYRNESLNSKLVFRAGIDIITDFKMTLPWPYLSLGYRF